MTTHTFLPAEEISMCFRARAKNLGHWLAKAADGSLKMTSNFALSASFPTKQEAEESWNLMLAQPEMQAKQSSWMAMPPLFFSCPDQDSPPNSLTLYVALCQGRFVGTKQIMGGSDFTLTPDLRQATIFTALDQALSAIDRVMPAKANRPTASILPLLATFAAPVQASEHGQDPLACSMAAASLRSAIEVDASPTSSKPKRLSL